jgi:hypothetical protein
MMMSHKKWKSKTPILKIPLHNSIPFKIIPSLSGTYAHIKSQKPIHQSLGKITPFKQVSTMPSVL